MKRTLPLAIALAFSGATFLSACGDDASRPAGTGGTAGSPPSSSPTPDQTKKPGSPAPTSPSGSGSTSGSGAKP